MPDILCPVCGKSNPDVLENCQYCGSRLRTKSGSLSGGTEPLGPVRVGEAPVKKGTGELERTLPKWLRDIRSGKDPNSDENPSAAPAKPLQPEEPEPKPSFSAEPRRVSMRPLRKTGELRSKTGELKSRTEDLKSQLPPAPAPAPQADFLAGLSSAKSGEDEEVPDWLASIQKKAERSTQPLSRPTIPGAASSVEQQPPAAPEPAFVSPFSPSPPPGSDWMNDQPEEPEPPAPVQPAVEQPSTGVDDVSAWLRGLDNQQTAAPETGPRPASASPFSTDDVPDWLRGPDAPASAPPSQPAVPAEIPMEVPSSEGPSFDETPDWLADMIAEMPDAKGNAVGGKPDWLKTLDGTGAEGPTEITFGDPPTPPSVPDWMTPPPAAAPAAEGESPNDDAKIAKPFDTGSLNWLRDEVGAADLPNWLSSLPGVDEPAGTVAPAVESPAPNPAFEPSSPNAPAFAAPPEPSPLIMDQNDMTAGGRPDALFGTEMPDWLSGMAPGESGRAVEKNGGDDIARAELPSWVQAMRPIESAMPEGSAGSVEERGAEMGGPLAGLRDVLPAASGPDMPLKPVAFSSRLALSDNQQSQAALLENLLAAETLPGSALSSARIRPLPWLRWGIALLLLLVIGSAVLLGSQGTQLVALPPIAQPEIENAAKVLALQPGSPVLVVFDYEPGLSGEVETDATPVLGQLMLEGARITILSTSPTGALLAERLINTRLAERLYKADQQYVNLGYLSGGTTAISGFAANPAQSLPLTINGTNAWETPVLAGVQKLSDFKAVVVITDNADTGRAWVEQTHLGDRLGGTPMVMAISAQAEPMIRPYYDAGQVQGIVSGLVGGVTYETYSGIPSQGHNYWDSFSLAFLVAEIAMVAGGMLGLLSAWRARAGRAALGDEG